MYLIKLKKIKFFICLVALCFVLILSYSAFAQNSETVNWNSMHSYGNSNDMQTIVKVCNINGINTLIMPSTCLPGEACIYIDLPQNTRVTVGGDKGECDFISGNPINLNELCSDDYCLKFNVSTELNNSEYNVKLIFLTNLSTMYISSDDCEKNGRIWVESSPDKSNKATGTIVLQNPDGNYVYSGSLTQIKGRGNSTWGFEKKPYQIKLDKKVDLLESHDNKNSSKTWVLLANYIDSTVIRNSLALDLGKALGMETNIESRHVDLFYDGQYRGNYLLTEKVEVAPGRVNITNLEDENAACNSDGNIETFPITSGTTNNGAVFTYCDGMKSPDDITGGYLLEMDYEVRALEEVCYFKTSRGKYVVVKSPEYASKEEMNYIATLYQEYEDAVYNGGTNPVTGKSYNQYIDATSVANYFLVNEFSKSRDCFKSSAYLYKDKGDKKFIMGPLWDYDMSFGKGGDDFNKFDSCYGITNLSNDFAMQLLGIESFYTTLKEQYNMKMYPYLSKYLSSCESNDSTFDKTKDMLADSANCNMQLWYPDTDWNSEVMLLKNFLFQRQRILKTIFDTYPSVNPMPEHRYFDILADDWFYEDVSQLSKLGYINGTGNYLFKPYDYVQRSHIVQALYNISDSGEQIYNQNFSDVSSDDWYAPAIEWACCNNICNWGKSGSFYPDKAATRTEIIECLYNFVKPEAENNENLTKDFLDAEKISPDAIPAFTWAVKNGIISGYEDKSLKPLELITRAELSAILVRYSKIVK